MTDKERIEKAAIKYKSKIYIGFDHGECFKQLNNPEITMTEIEQGFITSSGEFVNRNQATRIAIEAGQIDEYTAKQCLISEDLHLNWLNELQNNQNQKAIEALQEVKERVKALRDLEISAVRESREFNFKTEEARLGWIKMKTESSKIYNSELKVIDNLIKEYGGNDE